MNPNRFNGLAREIAKLSLDSYSKSFHVSIIVFGKSYVWGINNEKTHPDILIYGNYKTRLHSEMAAFIKVKNVTDKNLTLINYRFNKQLDFRNSKPCDNCMKWCRLTFSHIYYTNEKGLRRLY